MKWRSRALPKQKETGKAKKVRNVLQSFFFPSYLISEAYLQSVPRYTLATTRTPPVYCTICFLTSNTSTYATFISEVQLLLFPIQTPSRHQPAMTRYHRLHSIFRLSFVCCTQRQRSVSKHRMQRNTMNRSQLSLKNVRFHGKLIKETVVVNFTVCDGIKSQWDKRNWKVVKLSSTRISHTACVNLTRALCLCDIK